METIKRLSAIVILSYLLIAVPATTAMSQDDEWWEANKPETQYLTQLALADSVHFLNEFEYPFKLVLSKQEQVEYTGLASQLEQKFYIRNYLKKHNGNPLLPYNYWLIEYLARYAHARAKFEVEEAPYFDIRGEYYIKYGKPFRKFENNKGHVIVPFGRPFQVYKNESWYFDNDENILIVHFAKKGKKWEKIKKLTEVLKHRRIKYEHRYWKQLIIEREQLCNNYSILSDEIQVLENHNDDFINSRRARSFQLDFMNFSQEIESMMREADFSERSYLYGAQPNISTTLDKVSNLEIDYDIVQFKNPNGKTNVNLKFMASIDEILNKRHTDDEPDSMNVEFQFLIRDNNFESLINMSIPASFPYQKSVDANLPYVISNASFPAIPLNGDLTVQIADTVGGNKGFKKVPFNVRDFSGDSLMVSDIQLYMRPQNDMQKELLPVTKINQLEIIPYPYINIYSLRPPAVFFEIYNLQKAGIFREYEIDISVTRTEVSRFSKLFKFIRDPKLYKTSLVRTRQVEGNDSSELIEFDISSLKEGKYLLEVVVTDKGNKSVTARVSKNIKVKRF